MEVKLVVTGGARPGQEIAVAGPKFVIGRAPECQLRPNSDMVSRRHCAILLEEGSVTIHDFGSKNGTFVNDEKVEADRQLKTGDRVKVGPLEFQVRLSVSVGGKRKPKVHNVQEAAVRTVELAGDREMDISGGPADWDEEEVPAASSETQAITTTEPLARNHDRGAARQASARRKGPPNRRGIEGRAEADHR